MKILIDTRLYGLENTGIGRYIMNLVGELEKLDHENQYILLLRVKYFSQLKCPENFIKVRADFRHYSLLEQIELPLLIKKYKPDIVHFPHFNVPLAYKGKFVVTIHDLLMHQNQGLKATTLPAPLYFTKRIAYKSVFKKAVKSSTMIITPSKSVKKELESNYNIEHKKVTAIYEGVNSVKTDNVAKSSNLLIKYKIDKPYFIYTGNAYPHKNLERAIRAVKLLNQHSKIQFAIVSARGVFTEKLEKLVAKYDVKDIVRLLGYVPEEELSVLYKNALGFLYPSLYEGFGLPGLEAMSAGTLAIISRIPVFEEIYKDNAIYFDPYHIESILYSLKKAVKMNTAERMTLIAKSQKFIQRYSWEKMAKETLDVYNAAFGK